MIALQNTFGRLMRFSDNEREVAKIWNTEDGSW